MNKKYKVTFPTGTIVFVDTDTPQNAVKLAIGNPLARVTPITPADMLKHRGNLAYTDKVNREAYKTELHYQINGSQRLSTNYYWVS